MSMRLQAEINELRREIDALKERLRSIETEKREKISLKKAKQ